MKSEDKLTRADIKFIEELDNIARERYIKKMDKKLKSRSRLTKAITRHLYWQKIKKDILKAELK